MPVVTHPEGMVARFPRLAVGRSRTYVVGVDIQLLDNRPVRENPLVVWELGGRSIGRPPGVFTFLFPKGAVDSRDRLHLLWAEPAKHSSRIEAIQWVFLRPASIWTAIYEPSRGWSDARRLAHEATGPEGLKWPDHRFADNLGSTHSGQGIGLPERRPPRNAPLVYLTLSDTEWTRREIPVSWAAYVSVAARDDHLFVAYVDVDESWVSSPLNPTHHDVNSVFLRISRDGGQTWSSPSLISRSGEYPAHQVQALLGPRGDVHLLWKQETPHGTVIRHVLSRDGGTVWSEPHDLVPLGHFDNLGAVVDRCGELHLVYEDWRAGVDRIHIDYATWDGQWSAPVHLFESLLAMTADIQLASTGEPILVFVARDADAAATEHFETLYARLEPGSDG